MDLTLCLLIHTYSFCREYIQHYHFKKSPLPDHFLKCNCRFYEPWIGVDMLLESWETTPRWCLPAGRDKKILASSWNCDQVSGQAHSHRGKFLPWHETDGAVLDVSSRGTYQCQSPFLPCLLHFNCWHIHASHTRRLRLQTGITLQGKASQGAQVWFNVPAAAQTMEGGDSCPLDQPRACALSSRSALKCSEFQ